MAGNHVGTVSIGVEVDASKVPGDLASIGKKIGSGLGGAIGTTLKVGVGAAVAGVAGVALAVGGVAASAFSKGFQRLTAIDNAKAKLDGLKFSAEQVTSVMDSALKAVKGTAFGLGDAATIASIFGATGVKAGDQMTRALKLTADAATVGGTSLQDMGDVLSDVSAMGKVTGDTLNRMGERGIDALGMIAEHYGVDREAARKMVSAGKVDFDNFATAMEKSIGGAAMSSGKTFEGAMANVNAALGRLGAAALQPIFDAIIALAPILITAIDGIAEAFKPIFAEIGPKVAAVFTIIGDTIAKIDWATVAATVQTAWTAVEDVFTRLWASVQTLGDTFTPVWEGIVAAVQSIDWQVVGDVIVGVFDWIIQTIDRVVGATGGLGDKIGEVWDGISTWLGTIDWQEVQDTIVGAWDAIVTAVEGVIGVIQDLWAAGLDTAVKNIGDALADIDWPAVSQAIEDITDKIGEWAPAILIATGVIYGIMGVVSVFKAVKGAITAVKTAMFVYGAVTQGAATAQEALEYAQGKTTKGLWLSKAATAAATAVTKIKVAWDWLQNTVTWANTAALLANPITWIIVGIVAVIAAIVLLIMNWDKVTKFITDTWEAFMGWITPVLEGFAGWWEDIWGGIVTFFTDLWEGVSGWFTDMWEGIVQTVTDIIDGFMAWWTPIWDGIWAVIKLVIDLVVNYFRFWAAVYKWLWEHAVQPALQAIADFFTWLWENAIQPVIDWITGALQAMGDWFTMVWEDYIQPAIKAIGDFFVWLWEQAVKVVIGFIEAEIEGLGIIFQWLYDNIVKPVFDAIAGAFTWLWENGIKPVIDFIVGAFQEIGRWFTWLYENVVKPIWDGIMDAFRYAWEWIDDHVFTPFKDAIASIQTAFQNVADALPAIWDTIKKAVAEPINFVLGTVWNDGLRSFWNDLVTELDLKDMKLPKAPLVSFAGGGVLPGYTPGRDVHQFYSPTGGRLALSGGEGIIRPDALRRLGGKKWLDEVNGKRGLIGDGKGTGQNWVGDIWDAVQKGAAVAWEFFADPAAAIQKYVIDGIIKPLTSQGDPNIFGKTVSGVIGNFVTGFTDIFDKASPGPAGGGKGMGWEAMQKLVLAGIPGTSITSTFRQGAKTVNGGQSYHALGRAIDIIPANMKTFESVRKMFPNATELIYTPAGGRQLPNANWSAAVKKQHYNHIHLAMKNGGIFDNGGWLGAGGIGMNKGRRPEAVFTAAQFASLERNVTQMDMLLGAVRGYNLGLGITPGGRPGSGNTDNSRQINVNEGAFKLSGPDPYEVSLMTVNRLAEKVGL